MLGEKLAKIDELEAREGGGDAADARPTHLLVRRAPASKSILASADNTTEFQVQEMGTELYLATQTVGFDDAPTRLLTMYARGEGDILEQPQKFVSMDPVRKLLWTFDDSKWSTEPLKSTLEYEGSHTPHNHFVETGWEPVLIVKCPFPFDGELQIAAADDDLPSEITDSHGGVVVQGGGLLQ